MKDLKATMEAEKPIDESDSSMRQRLVNSLSQSFPGSALSKALQLMDSDDGSDTDPLSQSCFGEISLDKSSDMDDDEELTSLSWLQDSDLLKNMNAAPGAGPSSDTIDGECQKENADGNLETVNGGPQIHPPHVPYNPHKHVNSKPPYSFSCLIFMAIEDSPQKRLPVKDIYNWILTHFPYFQNAPTGWKNSVRHNLSLNKCFKKVDKEKGQSIGKGSLWCIDPEYRPNLLQALRKTPYHPYHQLQMLANPQQTQSYSNSSLNSPKPMPLSQRINFNTPSPHLFPFLSKRLAQSKINSESDIDVANALVSLKGSAQYMYRVSDNPRLKPLIPLNNNGLREKFWPYPKRRPGSPVIFTTSPSEDHTYSASSYIRDTDCHRSRLNPVSPVSSIDEEYEFGHNRTSDIDSSDDSYRSDASDYNESDGEGDIPPQTVKKMSRLSLPVKKRYTAYCDDEEMKIVEGADALLNLAGIKTSHIVPMRSISPAMNNNLPYKVEAAS
ncbi:forkhead box protein N3-like isoform X2 [Tubulanus polymorphus]|uniref:forkhead box protein N3-like isoform X2 n=1 Tax=Tubulanus polymorphus TaxID=672921 RepID=UPI003DA1C990